MSNIQILEVRLHLSPLPVAGAFSKKRFKINVAYSNENSPPCSKALHLPIKETAYLWAWMSTQQHHGRTNSASLGLIKAEKLASLLTGDTTINFSSSFDAYQFFKRHCDSAYLRLLLGNDADEIAIKLESNPAHKVLGGYLGGETESKDKSRCRTELLNQIDYLGLVKKLLPQQVKDQNDKRLLNTFYQPMNFTQIVK